MAVFGRSFPIRATVKRGVRTVALLLPGSDQYIDNVKLLMGFEGANNSTGAPGMTDESLAAHGTATVTAGVKIGNTQAKFGSTSLSCPQSGNIYFADSDDWNFGAGNFTVECFIFPTGGGTQFIVGQWTTNPQLGWILYYTGSVAWNTSTTGNDNNADMSSATGLVGGWNHVCVDYDGIKYRLYINGTKVAQFATPRTLFNSTDVLTIAANGANSAFQFGGFIDELRITKGVARYATDTSFTVPTSAFLRSNPTLVPLTPSLVTDTDSFFAPTVVAGAATLTPALFTDTDTIYTTGDPDFSSVKLLLGFDVGANGSTGAPGMTDESPAAHGTGTATNSSVSNSQSAIGSQSLFRNGTGGVTFLDSADWDLGSSPFTIELRMRGDGSIGGFPFLISQWGGGQNSWVLLAANQKLCFNVSTTGADNIAKVTGFASLFVNSWTAVAVDFDGTKYRTYINGVMDGQSSILSTLFNSSAVLTIGDNDYGGYIDEIRITKGVARYASDGGYTLAADAFPRYGGTLTVAITDQTLVPSLYSDTDTFFAPTVAGGAVTLTAALFTDTDTFFAPTVSAGDYTLTAALFTDTDTFFAPTLLASYTLTAALVTDTDTFYAPTATAQGSVTPGLYASDDTFFAPTVVPGSVSMLPGLVTDADAIYAVGAEARNPLLPALFDDTDTFYAPALSNAASLLPSLVVDADVIFEITAPNTTTLTPPFVDSDAVIYNPTVTNPFGLVPSLFDDANTFFAPALIPGPVSVLPSRVIDLDTFWTAFANNVKGNGNGGGGGGGNVPANLKYASQLTMTESGLIFALEVESNAVKTINTRMMIYADNGANLPGALLGQSATKTSVVVGANNYPLIVPVSRLIGQKVWIALHSDGAFTWFLDTTAGRSKFNTDLFSDGPSDPFGSTSNENKQAPVFLLFLSSAPIGMTPGLVTDTDTFFAPAVTGSKTLTAPFLTDTDFFLSPVVLSAGMVLPTLIEDTDTFYAPSLAHSASLLPGLVPSDDSIVSPFVSKSDYFVFAPFVASDDTFFAPTVSQSGANLHPALFDDTDSFYSPFVAAFAPTIFNASVPSDDTFFAPTITVSGAALTANLVDDTDTFFAPIVSRSPFLLFSADVPNDDDIHQATVTSFGAGLPAPFFDDTDTFFAPEVVVAYQLATAMYDDTDTFFVATVSQGLVTLVPELTTSGEDFYDPVVTRLAGTDEMTPELFVDDDTFYSPTNLGNLRSRRQVYLSGRNDSNKELAGT